MKRITLLTALLSISSFIFSQTFAPVGATWHYHLTEQGDTSFVKIESTHDTIILGKSCQALKLPGTCKFFGENRISLTSNYEVYIHSSTDSVFLYHEFINSFQLLYAFNAQVGDSWSFLLGQSNKPVIDTVQITVDSIYSETINAQLLRGLKVRYSLFSYDGTQSPWVTESHFSEVIGDFDFLFNFPGMTSAVICDEEYPSKLRCYSDNTFGSYETGIVDSCSHTAVYVGVEEIDVTDINLWPNPVKNVLFLQNDYLEGTEIGIFDITGSLLFSKSILNSNQVVALDVSSLDNGIYFVQVKSPNKTISKKIVKL
jgi:hypothetical protein